MIHQDYLSQKDRKSPKIWGSVLGLKTKFKITKIASVNISSFRCITWAAHAQCIWFLSWGASLQPMPAELGETASSLVVVVVKMSPELSDYQLFIVKSPYSPLCLSQPKVGGRRGRCLAFPHLWSVPLSTSLPVWHGVRSLVGVQGFTSWAALAMS